MNELKPGCLLLSLVVFLAHISCTTHAQDNFLPFNTRVAVVDEAGTLIGGAEVSVDAYLPESERKSGRRYAEEVKTSSVDAPVRFEGKCLGRIIIRVNKEGYHTSWMEYWFKISYETQRYEPWDQTFSLVLKLKANPRPLFVHRVDWLPVPSLDIPIGFDLEKGDWVAPHGKGLHSDFLFVLSRQHGAGPIYRGEMDVLFSNEMDGLVRVPRRDGANSLLLLGQEAPPTDYQPKFERVVGVTDAGGDLARLDDPTWDELQDCEGFWFRVRSEIDEETGVLRRARYGKIDAYIDFAARAKDKPAHVAFTYYLAPDDSRSVEWNGESLVEGADLQGVTRY